jgi:hypothetical protein
MTLHVTTEDVQAWLETTKMTVSSLDIELEQQIASETLGALQGKYPSYVSSWVDATSTPVIVKKVIAMQLAAWMYLRQYSESDDSVPYANLLLQKAGELLAGLSSGATDIIEVPGLPTSGQPVFFPTDVSSATIPTPDSPSDGPPKFSMAQVF